MMYSDKELKDIAAGYVFEKGTVNFSPEQIIDYGLSCDVPMGSKEAEMIDYLISMSAVTVQFEDGCIRHDWEV